MNKKVKHICDVLITLFLPFAKEYTKCTIYSLTPYAVIKMNKGCVHLDVSHFTIFHLEITVINEKNILCTMPPDFDDSELDNVLIALANYHQKVVGKLMSKEHKIAALEAQKELIEQKITAIKNEN